MFKFPYTNFHEINLDWVLEQLAMMKAKLEEFMSEFPTLKDLVESFNTRITNTETGISNLHTRVAENTDNITQNYIAIGHNEENIDTIMTHKIPSLEDYVTDHENRLDALGVIVEDNTDDITELKTITSPVTESSQLFAGMSAAGVKFYKSGKFVFFGGFRILNTHLDEVIEGINPLPFAPKEVFLSAVYNDDGAVVGSMQITPQDYPAIELYDTDADISLLTVYGSCYITD